MKTYTVTLSGEKMAMGVVSRLVQASQWFTFEPMPDEDYEISVKAENKRMLDQLIVEITFA